MDEFAVLFGGDIVLAATDKQRHHRQNRHLRRESLGTCNANFGTRVSINARIRGATDATAHDVANADDTRAAFFGELYGSQCVSGFARLTYGNHNILRIDDWVSVTELRGVLHLYGYPRIFLKKVFAQETRVPTRAAAHNDNPPCIHQMRHHGHNAAESKLIVMFANPSTESVHHGARLFKNLLQHKMLKTAFLNFVAVEVNLLGLGIDDHIFYGFDYNAFATDDGNILIVEINHLVGKIHKRRSVGGYEIFLLTDANDERTTRPGGDEFVGFVGAIDGETIRAAHFGERKPHSVLSRNMSKFIDIFNQIRQYFRVGLRMECVAARSEFFLQYGVILDDAVVYNHKLAVHRDLRMRVDVVWCAVCGPTCMADADSAGSWLVADKIHQIRHLAFHLVNIRSAAVHNGNARRIISTVFEPTEAVDNDRVSIPESYISYNATHSCKSFRIIYIS